MLDVIIIGGGPAGASCGLWLHQFGLDVLLLESSNTLGGLQRRSPYPNVWIPGVIGRTGQQVARALHAHVMRARVPCRLACPVQRLDCRDCAVRLRVAAGGRTFSARRVVIATGAQPRSGGFVPGERIAIGPGLPMAGLHVEGRRVAILGGGDNAFEQAMFSMQRGARSVDVYCRSAPRAQPQLVRAIPARQVHVGPFAAEPETMMVNRRPHDLFGVQFGFEPRIPAGADCRLEDGFIRVDRSGATSVPGLYAAGEVTNFWHPCVATACAHGIQVAKSIQQSLQAGATQVLAAQTKPIAAAYPASP